MIKNIGRYEIRREAGQGGMSTVYEAFDPYFKRAVAVKVMTRELMGDPKFKARFEREAQTIAALEHPAIVPVYDFGEDDQRPFLVMRLMNGGTLSDRLQDGPLSVSETARILKRIGSALERAHDQGVIHRDLKPSNIMFDQYGDAFLADFGIARVTEGAVNLTGENVIGTPAYMSPEQIHGDQAIDGRSDIYALGVICFEMLTGRRPYEEQTPVKLMMQHIIDPVPDIREIRPDLPAEVALAINRTMAKSPEERYTRASELTDTLESLAHLDAARPPAVQAPDAGKAPADPTPAALAQSSATTNKASQVTAPTIPDSGERLAPVPPPEPTPGLEAAPSPAPASAAERPAAGSGRAKWLIPAVIALGILAVVIFAVVFFGDRLRPGSEETADVPEQSAEAAAPGKSGEDSSAAPAESPAEETGDMGEPNVEPTADALMGQFYDRMGAEDYEAAEEAIDQVMALLPRTAWLHAEKAWLMESIGDPDRALAELQTAVELEPDNSEYYAYRGNIYRDRGDLEAALAEHQTAVELNPDDPQIRMELAETYMQLEDPGSALEQYNQAVALKDDEAWYFESRAKANFLVGDYDQGLADLEQAAERDPDLGDFYTKAGEIVLDDLGDAEKALEYYNQAVERSPDDAWVYAERAAAYETLENSAAALADLNQAIELEPEISEFYVRRGLLYLYHFDDDDAALADLNQAVEIDPENPDAFAERASFFQYYAGDMEAALEDRSRALSLEPEGPWRYGDRAVVYRELGREEEALDDLNQCLVLDPEYYWCSLERGRALDALGRTREAAADFQQFLDLAAEDDCPECHEEAQQYIQENQ